MLRPIPRSNHFVLEAFDRSQWCAVLQTRFHVPDLPSLRSILGEAAADDPALERIYHPSAEELAAIAARFSATIDHCKLESDDLVIGLFRWRDLWNAPYLVHTGYELPLLLDGRKKLARLSHEYPPMTFDGEDRFNHWVVQGLLHQEEFVEPFDHSINTYLGTRAVYYTPKGEEWRVPASRLIWNAARKSGGWNEYFERLEGMLFGYEDWQNDWWIDTGLQQGGFGGVSFCCTVTAKGLTWIEAAGFRALPPIEKSTFPVARYHIGADSDLHAFMLEDPDSAALVRFNVLGRAVVDFMDLQCEGPYTVPANRIPELNRGLLKSVVIAARRDDPGSVLLQGL